MSAVEIDIDEIKQREKSKNIITRLDQEQMSKEKIVQTLNEKPESSITKRDINYTIKMTRGYETGRTQEINQVKVVFHSKEIKTKIFKLKNKLKGNEQIWLKDTLRHIDAS